MSTKDQIVTIRSRKLGVLLFDARSSARRSVEECAAVMAVAPERYSAYEQGSTAPSLPELEALAFFLDIPLEHFWSSTALSEKTAAPGINRQAERLLRLRHRIIGTYLRLGRSKANLSTRELAEKTGVDENQIKAYELGEQSVPLPELEILAQALGMRIEEFFDQSGPIGKWRSDQQSVRQFLDLPPELQQFVCRPVNRPYLDLAMRLSELSVEKLRAVAEGLLEITY